MDITGPRRVDSANVRRTKGTSSASTGFSTEEAHDAQRATGLTGSGPLAAVDTILALQGLEDSVDSRKQSVSHGEQLLSLLDEVRDGLLTGGIPRLTLTRLAMATSKRREGFTDPKLQDVLDEIDLRARVELAKLEQSDAQVPRQSY